MNNTPFGLNFRAKPDILVLVDNLDFFLLTGGGKRLKYEVIGEKTFFWKGVMMRFTRFIIVGLGIFLLSCLATEGSVIVQQLNGPADLDLSGNIIYAINFGNNGSPNVGGVAFSQDEDYSAITLDVLGEGPSSWFGTLAGTGYAGLDLILNGMAYRFSDITPIEISLNAGGLTIGKPYLLQLIAYEPDNTNRNGDIFIEDNEIITAFNPIVEQGGIVGQGGSVIKYEFMATDPILNIRLLSHENAVGLNGFILTEVPEPATISLFALGAVALLKRKR